VARYPDMREMARGATESYDRIDALDQIKPPYPAQGSPNWWALRMRYEQLLMAKIRRHRADNHLNLPLNAPEAEAAKWAALGNETADRDYHMFANVPANVPDMRKRFRQEAARALG
jgi:hypothetical protein